ncbi:MAG: M42 family metallopeptidase [Clostridiales bacterium]|nr:M42 family metallopeptidase [Clostridiales bacterium]
MEELINTPSPVGYYDEMNPLLETYAEALGYEVTYDRKKTAYIRVKGEDSSKTICVGAHVDTLGLMIRAIDKDGLIRVRNLGGINYNNVEGESVTIHTRDGRKYTGLAACQYHSVHVFDEAKTAIRDESNMVIILDEDVHSREEVKALGIEIGDTISLEPHFTVTETGYIKSRFIDDKACVAAVFAVLKYMKEHHIAPSYDTLFAFPYYEEIGHGGAYVPKEVSSYIALDIGVIGPDHAGSEEQVSICVKDNFSPYDRGLTGDIIRAAKEAQIDHVVDVFYRYGTDATAALRAGNNVRAAAFGMGTYSSHGMERTSIHAVEETGRLLLEVLKLKGDNF